jgi:two-component system sensor histidine kinase BaeS
MSKLRWKLLAAMVALVAVTIGITALFARRVAHDQVYRLLLVKRPVLPPDDALRPLVEHFRSTGGWRGVDAVIDRIAAASHARIVLASMRDDVIAVSTDLRGAQVTVDGEDRVTVIGVEENRRARLTVRIAPLVIRDGAGGAVARAYVLPAHEPEEPAEQRELAAVDRRLVALFALATLIALALSVVISRRITKPIEHLTCAVQALGRGTMPAPVRVTGQDEIARLATAFNAMARAVASQEELRRRMAADVAHELRTPLTNLRCELEAIQDGLAAPDGARIDSLHEEVLHLQRLVEDLQELALADAGALRLARERLELGPAIARVVGDRAEVTAEDGLVVDADPTRLRQVMDNLLANAAAHAPAGGRARVRVARDGAAATVSVSDDGPGIPAAELERIFERFYRLDEARGRSGGGAGLGLAIVSRLVELHGGRVWAESAPGQGATFTFRIPLASS